MCRTTTPRPRRKRDEGTRRHVHRGRLAPAAGQDVIEVVNPVDEQVIGTVPAGTAEDVDTAVRAARAALGDWAATPPAERAARLAALRDVLVARADEVAETVTAELGSPLKFSQAVHAGVPIAVAGSYAELAATYAFEEKTGNSVVHHEPVGVVAAITPWNYPCTRSSPRSPRPSRRAARSS